jgi:outer membrane protein assembly factor BamD (BamD/ComL family)
MGNINRNNFYYKGVWHMRSITISGTTRKYILVAVLAVTIISLIAAFSVAAEQDKAFRGNYQLYQQANSLMQEEKYAQAQVLLNQLDQNSKDSYQVLYRLGICSGAAGDYTAAVNYLQRVQETRPAILLDQTFLMEYGKYLYLQGEYARAKLYLLESKKYNTNPEATKEAEKYLAQIDEKERAGGKT